MSGAVRRVYLEAAETAAHGHSLQTDSDSQDRMTSSVDSFITASRRGQRGSG